jgi:hypothetical protein
MVRTVFSVIDKVTQANQLRAIGNSETFSSTTRYTGPKKVEAVFSIRRDAKSPRYEKKTLFDFLWAGLRQRYMWGMVTPTCDKCRRRNVVSFHVEPKEAWRTVVLNRRRTVCHLVLRCRGPARGCAVSIRRCRRGIVERCSGAGHAVRQEATLGRRCDYAIPEKKMALRDPKASWQSARARSWDTSRRLRRDDGQLPEYYATHNVAILLKAALTMVRQKWVRENPVC